MKIVIDARESGTSTGRYIDKLIEHLHRLWPEQTSGFLAKARIIILVRPKRVDFIKKIAPRFGVVNCPYKEFSLSEQFGLLSQINSLAPDLVHFGMTQQPVFYGGKVVTTIHDLTTARFDNPAKAQLVFKTKQQVYRWLIRKVARKSVKLIVPSQFVKKDVAQYANIDPDKIVVVHEAAEPITETAEPVAKLTDKKFLMYVGRPNPHKNLERLLEAFIKIKQKHSELILVLVGQNDENYERLQKYSKKLGLDSLGYLTPHQKIDAPQSDYRLLRSGFGKGQASQVSKAGEERNGGDKQADVIFTGQISDGQLRWLYENTAAYVFPSLSEGFGLPGLEAMVHGAPVVAAKASCLPEIYGDAAHYFDPFDVDDMAAKIAEVLDNFALSTNLIARGKAQAAKYSWTKTASKTLKVYQDALNR